jgi:hypothetical protein
MPKPPRAAARSSRPSAKAADRFVLLRDGKEIMRGSSFEIARYIHRNHSYSVDHALKHEGYSMVPAKEAEAKETKAKPNPRGTLSTYGGHRPTGFDSHLPLAGREDWLIVPVSRNRDSGMLDESNFEAALEILGGESDDVEVHRFGHWGPGWYEIIIVRPGSKAEKEAEEIEAALANYPVLNDEDHSQREYDATISNIRQILSSVERKNDIEKEFPEDTAEKIFGWLWTNDQMQLENRDDQGGYPSDEAVEAALQGLGLWAGPPDEEGNAPEPKENPKSSPARNPSTGPRLQVGNAFYTPALRGRSSWKRIPNDDWEPVIVDEDEVEKATFVGTRPIDGTAHNIFEMHFAPGSRGYYAQMQHMTSADEAKMNPAGPATRIDRRKLGEMMSPWGGDFAYGEGIGSVGAVASFYSSGKPYPQREYVEKAIRAIEADIPQAQRGMHGWTTKDARELRTIAAGLRYYLAKDYSKGGAAETPSTNPNPKAKDWDADELVLYADNTSELYGMKQAIQKNLLKKKKAGKYKPKLAEVAWMHFAEAAAKRYSKEFGGKWHENFPVPVREEAAAQWARTFEESGFEIG